MQAFTATIVPTGGQPFFAIVIPTGTPGPGDLPHPEHPIAGGPWPSHPIFYPPGTRPPGQGGGGPVGPWGPNDPRPTPPIAEPPWGWGGTPPPGVPTTPPAGSGVVVPLPEGTTPPAKPEGVPADSTAMVVWFGPGTLPTIAWVPPYAATQP